ncbi:hypothetical protein EG856_00845 [Mycoplasmopsis phocirhinis]|uniref:Lipoprotein n=1 Tax=Mycoplasmopsis phocirhinis TaxID=142650 RepID=A0A4P6MT37_9BACT|nr:hypothetical protein [Mycoplasmopsis phocirhinis]QBF34477.1 hypothetical protein EG856_00845 [Mycoplasmopsis phocirhinis]
MKPKFLKLTLVSALFSTPFIAVGCMNTNNPKANEAQQINLEFTTLKGVVKTFANQIKQSKEQFYESHPNTNVVIHKLLSFNHKTKQNLSNVLNEVIKQENSQMFLSDKEISSWSDEEKELYNEWFKTNQGLNHVNNVARVAHDFDTQLGEKIQILKENNAQNEVVKFEIYLNSLFNKNFVDSEMNENFQKLELFIKTNLYDKSEQKDNDDHQHNHSQNLQDHTHSHALINIAQSAIEEAEEFSEEFNKVLSLKAKFETLTNETKKDFYLNKFYKLIDVSNDFRNIVKKSENEIDVLKNTIKNVFTPLDKIKTILNINN